MRVALVLGSGSAKGYAHVGVIEELKSRGHDIVAISGSSMGAVVGGIEAAGKLDEFTEWATSLSNFDVIRLTDFTLGKGGFVKANRFVETMRELLGDIHIENLPIPYTAVATDITARREVWFQRGSLVSAMRASIAIPGFITPVLLDGHLIADGGVLNPVPVEPTLPIPADITIAVSLHGRDDMMGMQLVADSDKLETSEDDDEPSAFTKRIGERFAHLFGRWADANTIDEEDAAWNDARAAEKAVTTSADDTPAQPSVDAKTDTIVASPDDEIRGEIALTSAGASTLEVMDKSLMAMEDTIERIRAAISPAHVRIEVPATVCSSWDFHRAAEVIEAGRALAIREFDRVGL